MLINRWSDEMDSPWNEPIYCGDPSEEIWTMRDGTEIRVGDMTDIHLNNCWKMVDGKSPIWKQIFEAETKKRAEKRYK
jgi:hypothetical protein